MDKMLHVSPPPTSANWREISRLLTLHKVGEETRFSAGDTLWRHGEATTGLHFITAGVVRVVPPSREDGDITTDLVLPGELGNLPDLGQGGPGYGSGVALTGGRSTVVDTAQLRRLSARVPSWGGSCCGSRRRSHPSCGCASRR